MKIITHLWRSSIAAAAAGIQPAEKTIRLRFGSFRAAIEFVGWAGALKPGRVGREMALQGDKISESGCRDPSGI